MFIRTPPINVLQIFCESMIDFKVIFKSIISPNDICQKISRDERVKTSGTEMSIILLSQNTEKMEAKYSAVN